MEELLSLNNLHYLADTSANANIQRQQRIYYPEKSSYKSKEKISFKMHGNSFVDFCNSSLRFIFTIVGGTSATFSNNSSAVSLFNRCRVVAPGGEAISDLFDLNLLSVIESKTKQSKEYTEVVGSSYGLETAATARLSGTDYEFTIPLIHLSPFFKTGTLCPPQLVEGMIIELYLETAQQALEDPAGTPVTDFNVKECELICDSVLVADSVLSTVLDMSEGKNIMVYEFVDVVDNASFSSADENKIYFEIPQSLTNALEMVSSIRKSEDVNNVSRSGFSMIGPSREVSANINLDQYQAQLGSTKFPQQVALGASRIYQGNLYAQGVLHSRKSDCFSLTFDEFASESGVALSKLGVYMTDLRLSKMYNNAGRTISDNQRLSVMIKQFVSQSSVCNVFVYFTARVEIRNGRCTTVR
jgi:hypothetical protein